MAWKSLLSSLLFLGVIMIVIASPRGRFATPQEMKTHCAYVYNMPCQDDTECQCSYPVRLICNYQKVCNQISIVDIMKRIRCPNTFKKSCNSSDECNSACAGMICEDNECVDKKRITT